MDQQTTIIETVYDLEDKIKLLHNSHPLGTDTETKGLDPHTAGLRTVQLSDDKNTLVIDCEKIGYSAASAYIKPLLEDPDRVKIFHNAKFDCKFLKKHLDINVTRIFDTFLASVLLEAGVRTPRGHNGLGQVLDRYTGIKIDKGEQSSDWSAELTKSQLEYAAKDAQCLLPLREAQIEKLRRLGLFRVAQLEFEAVQAFAWLELSGFHLDMAEWGEVAFKNQERANEIADEIFAELSPVLPQGSLFGNTTFNLGSVTQVQKYFSDFGIPMPESTKEVFLQPLARKYPIIEKFIEWRGLTKSTSSFGDAWLDYVNPSTGRIHANFNQIGASTGRVSSSSPNLQQIPRDNMFRNCFTAAEGKRLLSADYSNIELRILADLANDKSALEAFESGKDFHTAMAGLVFNVAMDDVSSDMRSLAKIINFAIPYGAGRNKIAATAKISELEAEVLMSDYFKAVPNIKRWLDKQKRDVLKTKYARTASGRLAKFYFDESDGMQKSAAQRNAMNMPIQGTSCDILKRALRLLYDATLDRQHEIKLVNIVHDEINLEVDEPIVEEVGHILEDCMIRAGKEYLTQVKIKVDLKVSQRWAK